MRIVRKLNGDLIMFFFSGEKNMGRKIGLDISRKKKSLLGGGNIVLIVLGARRIFNP